MTKTDWTPEGQPAEETDPLSATGMFLSSFGKESEPAQKQVEESLAQPAPKPEPKQPAWLSDPVLTQSQPTPPASPSTFQSQPGSGGEFTKLFHASETSRTISQPAAPVPPPFPTAEATPATAHAPGEFTKIFQAAEASRAVSQPAPAVPPAVPAPEPKPASAPAPGEFTRIFVKGADPLAVPTPQPARTIPDLTPATPSAAASSRMKGFSSPGGSAAASAEGGFTQFFQARPTASAPAPAPAPRVETYSPPAPVPKAPAEEIKWGPGQSFGTGASPSDHAEASTSATGLLATLGTTGPRQAEIKAKPAEPFPSFTPAPPAEPSSVEPGSVTRLIQRLSETPRVPPPAELPPAAAEIPAAPISSGPGEFTRMISGSAIKAAIGAPAAPAAAAPVAPMAMPAVPAMPAPPPMPAAPKPIAAAPPPAPAFQAPKFEPPKVAAPAPPALAAPKSKLQELVPILLVVNTFLLLVLMVLVIFALRAK